MCHKYAKYLIAGLFLFPTALSVKAQDARGENILYSRYGIGELQDGTNVQLRGMGSVSTAFAAPFTVNTINPASYASLALTTYEAGAYATSRNVEINDINYSTGSASFGYVSIGIPVNKHLGLCFGLKPVSKVYYNMEDTSVIQDLGTNAYHYIGSGGTNYAFLGAAGKVGNLSVGANFGYLFGSIQNSSTMIQVGDSLSTLGAIFDKKTRIGGIYLELGGLYDVKLNKDLLLRLGATFDLKQNLNTTYDQYGLTSRYISDAGIYEYDTVTSSVEQSGKMTLPTSFSFGVQLASRDNWDIGVNVTATQWSQFRNNGNVDSVTDQSWKVAIGGEWTPNPAALRKYLQRITYRVGFNYGKDFVYLRNTDINYYAITGGLSLPFRRATDRIHFAGEIGKRGTLSNGLASENYIRISVGASLNAFVDRWFVKRKYD